MSNQIATLIPTIVGGILAIVGGFFATYITQIMARDAERRKVTREKIEEMYNLSNNVRDWALAQVSRAKEFRVRGMAEVPISPRDAEKQNPSGKLEMLAMLYFPALQSDIKEYISLAETLDVTHDAVVKSENVPIGESTFEITRVFKKSIDEDALNSILRDFEKFERLHVKMHASFRKFIQY